MTLRKPRPVSEPPRLARADIIRLSKQQIRRAAVILNLSEQQGTDQLEQELRVISHGVSLLVWADKNLDDKSQKARIVAIRNSARETLDLLTRFPAYLRGPPPITQLPEIYTDREGRKMSDAEVTGRYLKRVSENLSARLIEWKGLGVGNPGNRIEARAAASLMMLFQRCTGRSYPGTQKQGLRFVSFVLEAMFPALKGNPEKLRAILLRARKLLRQEFNPNSANS